MSVVLWKSPSVYVMIDGGKRYWFVSRNAANYIHFISRSDNVDDGTICSFLGTIVAGDFLNRSRTIVYVIITCTIAFRRPIQLTFL